MKDQDSGNGSPIEKVIYFKCSFKVAVILILIVLTAAVSGSISVDHLIMQR